MRSIFACAVAMLATGAAWGQTPAPGLTPPSKPLGPRGKPLAPPPPHPGEIQPAIPDHSDVLNDVTKSNAIAYVRDGDKYRRMDIVGKTVYAGKDNPRRPCIVWIHFGEWMGGSREKPPLIMLVNSGYVVASIDYRGMDVAKWPAQLEDCKAAIRYLRAHADTYWIDADHIGVCGAGGGGHLAAMLGTTGGVKELEGTEGKDLGQSSRVQAVCEIGGVTDFVSLKAGEVGATAMVNKLLGGTVQEKQALARAASPTTYCTADDAPMLILHGEVDQVIPPQQAEVLRDALKKAGVEVSLEVVERYGRGDAAVKPALGKIREFFDKHLKPKSAVQEKPEGAKP